MTTDEIEYFHLLAYSWNITKAKQYAAGHSPNGTLDPAQWRGILSLIVIDEDHAAQVELDEPVIAVTVPDGGPLIIDGWHRIHKAIGQGIHELPVILAHRRRRTRLPGTRRRQRDNQGCGNDHARPTDAPAQPGPTTPADLRRAQIGGPICSAAKQAHRLCLDLHNSEEDK